jgi:hypothetical protein
MSNPHRDEIRYVGKRLLSEGGGVAVGVPVRPARHRSVRLHTGT